MPSSPNAPRERRSSLEEAESRPRPATRAAVLTSTSESPAPRGSYTVTRTQQNTSHAQQQQQQQPCNSPDRMSAPRPARRTPRSRPAASASNDSGADEAAFSSRSSESVVSELAADLFSFGDASSVLSTAMYRHDRGRRHFFDPPSRTSHDADVSTRSASASLVSSLLSRRAPPPPPRRAASAQPGRDARHPPLQQQQQQHGQRNGGGSYHDPASVRADPDFSRFPPPPPLSVMRQLTDVPHHGAPPPQQPAGLHYGGGGGPGAAPAAVAAAGVVPPPHGLIYRPPGHRGYRVAAGGEHYRVDSASLDHASHTYTNRSSLSITDSELDDSAASPRGESDPTATARGPPQPRSRYAGSVGLSNSADLEASPASYSSSFLPPDGNRGSRSQSLTTLRSTTDSADWNSGDSHRSRRHRQQRSSSTPSYPPHGSSGGGGKASSRNSNSTNVGSSSASISTASFSATNTTSNNSSSSHSSSGGGGARHTPYDHSPASFAPSPAGGMRRRRRRSMSSGDSSTASLSHNSSSSSNSSVSSSHDSRGARKRGGSRASPQGPYHGSDVPLSPSAGRVTHSALSRRPVVSWRSTSRVCAIASVPSGQVLTGGDPSGLIEVWDSRTGRRLCALGGHQAPVLALLTVPNTSLLLSGGADRTARLWELRTLQNTMVLEGHRGLIKALATVWMPDVGLNLFTGSDDGTVRQWRAATGACVHVYHGHRGPINVVASLRPCKYIATGGSDGIFKLWNAQTLRCISSIAAVPSRTAAAAAATSNANALYFSSSSSSAAAAVAASTGMSNTLASNMRWSGSEVGLDAGNVSGGGGGASAGNGKRSGAGATGDGSADNGSWSGAGAVWDITQLHDQDQSIATATDDGAVRLWATQWTQHAILLKEFYLPGVLLKARSGARCLLACGAHVFVGGARGELYVWDTAALPYVHAALLNAEHRGSGSLISATAAGAAAAGTGASAGVSSGGNSGGGGNTPAAAAAGGAAYRVLPPRPQQRSGASASAATMGSGGVHSASAASVPGGGAGSGSSHHTIPGGTSTSHNAHNNGASAAPAGGTSTSNNSGHTAGAMVTASGSGTPSISLTPTAVEAGDDMDAHAELYEAAFLFHTAAITGLTRQGAHLGSSSLDHTICRWDLRDVVPIEGDPAAASLAEQGLGIGLAFTVEQGWSSPFSWAMRPSPSSAAWGDSAANTDAALMAGPAGVANGVMGDHVLMAGDMGGGGGYDATMPSASLSSGGGAAAAGGGRMADSGAMGGGASSAFASPLALLRNPKRLIEGDAAGIRGESGVQASFAELSPGEAAAAYSELPLDFVVAHLRSAAVSPLDVRYLVRTFVFLVLLTFFTVLFAAVLAPVVLVGNDNTAGLFSQTSMYPLPSFARPQTFASITGASSLQRWLLLMMDQLHSLSAPVQILVPADSVMGAVETSIPEPMEGSEGGSESAASDEDVGSSEGDGSGEHEAVVLANNLVKDETRTDVGYAKARTASRTVKAAAKANEKRNVLQRDATPLAADLAAKRSGSKGSSINSRDTRDDVSATFGSGGDTASVPTTAVAARTSSMMNSVDAYEGSSDDIISSDDLGSSSSSGGSENNDDEDENPRFAGGPSPPSQTTLLILPALPGGVVLLHHVTIRVKHVSNTSCTWNPHFYRAPPRASASANSSSAAAPPPQPPCYGALTNSTESRVTLCADDDSYDGSDGGGAVVLGTPPFSTFPQDARTGCLEYSHTDASIAFHGLFDRYDGAGYVVQMPLYLDNVNSNILYAPIEAMRRLRLVDQQRTRLVDAVLYTYHIHSKTFFRYHYALEVPHGGSWTASTDARPCPLYHHTISFHAHVLLASVVVITVALMLLLSFVLFDLVMAHYVGELLQHFFSLTVLVDVAVVVVGLCAVGYGSRWIVVSRSVDVDALLRASVPADPSAAYTTLLHNNVSSDFTAQVRRLNQAERAFHYLLTFAAAEAVLLFLGVTAVAGQLVSFIQIVSTTMRQIRLQMITAGAMIVLMLVAFSLAFHLLFGSRHYAYATIGRSLYHLLLYYVASPSVHMDVGPELTVDRRSTGKILFIALNYLSRVLCFAYVIALMVERMQAVSRVTPHISVRALLDKWWYDVQYQFALMRQRAPDTVLLTTTNTGEGEDDPVNREDGEGPPPPSSGSRQQFQDGRRVVATGRAATSTTNTSHKSAHYRSSNNIKNNNNNTTSSTNYDDDRDHNRKKAEKIPRHLSISGHRAVIIEHVWRRLRQLQDRQEGKHLARHPAATKSAEGQARAEEPNVVKAGTREEGTAEGPAVHVQLRLTDLLLLLSEEARTPFARNVIRHAWDTLAWMYHYHQQHTLKQYPEEQQRRVRLEEGIRDARLQLEPLFAAVRATQARLEAHEARLRPLAKAVVDMAANEGG